MTSSPAPPPTGEESPAIYSGMEELAAGYEGYILDLWGVIHDGVTVFPGVIDCLFRLREAGKRMVLLSNAPRRSHVIVEQLMSFGVPENLYDGIMSSGQEAYDHLSARDDPWYAALGERCFHIGPERDMNMLEGLSLQEVETLAEAEFILNTGPWDDGAMVADYEDILSEGARAKVPMICSNPDLEVIRGGVRMICAGALARRYEELGGEVRHHGKPDKGIYESCFRCLGIADHSHILAVGDSLRTDIAGAENAGIDSLLVTDGLHREEIGLARGETPDPVRLAGFCTAAGHFPNGAITSFRWNGE
ncbi:MAG: TIGR01459 family HAD-type hydrolase [Alphaproteobacteria bacterium]|nr:TIGR01459 family HAD-type hydrolase [Alphaproteobacteria bacterium]